MRHAVRRKHCHSTTFSHPKYKRVKKMRRVKCGNLLNYEGYALGIKILKSFIARHSWPLYFAPLFHWRDA